MQGDSSVQGDASSFDGMKFKDLMLSLRMKCPDQVWHEHCPAEHTPFDVNPEEKNQLRLLLLESVFLMSGDFTK